MVGVVDMVLVVAVAVEIVAVWPVVIVVLTEVSFKMSRKQWGFGKYPFNIPSSFNDG